MLKRLAVFFCIIFVGVGAFVAVSRSQDIIDWWKLRNYTPAPEIVALAESDVFSDLGRKLFYVNDPQLLGKTDFQGRCTIDEATIVLGCYIPDGQIYLYNVNDKRLNGVEEVTAAHEMLHAAYRRLEPDEKERIDDLLSEAYERIDDKRLREDIRTYETRDPSVVPNELHSILGTEVRDLPRDLENYYSQYFQDRSRVVSLSEDYEKEFVKRQQKIAAYDSQLTKLNGEIARLKADLALQGQALENELMLVEQLRGDHDEFNQSVTLYNQKVRQYNSVVTDVRGLTERYNNIVSKRNKIAAEEQDLIEAIDTRATSL